MDGRVFLTWRSFPTRAAPRTKSSPCYACCRRFQSLPKASAQKMANSLHDWNTNDSFFNFTRSRFLRDEADQISQRRVKFDMNELANVAAASIQAKSCVNVEKCPDGMYNKAYEFTMDDGRSVIGKVPNPNAGPKHDVTASEVATMTFMRNVLKIPVPKVLSWNSRCESSTVGSEYIIMEKVEGIPLEKVWERLRVTEQLEILSQVLKYQRKWTSTKFTRFGSLYFSGDVSGTRKSSMPLYIDENGSPVPNNEYTVGPIVGRQWVDNGIQNLPCDRGPWSSVYGYRKAVGERERMAILTALTFPKQDIMICGPGFYLPTKEKKLRAIDSYMSLLHYLLPSQAALQTGHIWHNDLHGENIFVSPDDPTRITGIIDWQSIYIVPLFDHNLDPGFFEFSTRLSGNSERPKLQEDYKSLPTEARTKVLKAYSQASLQYVWRNLVKSENPIQHEASAFSQSKPGFALSLSTWIFTGAEPFFLLALLELRDEAWSTLPAVVQAGNPAFPITFTEKEEEMINEDEREADRGMWLANSARKQLGDLWPFKGVIDPNKYEAAKWSVNAAREDFAERAKLTAEEKKEFEKFWPFDCSTNDPGNGHSVEKKIGG